MAATSVASKPFSPLLLPPSTLTTHGKEYKAATCVKPLAAATASSSSYKWRLVIAYDGTKFSGWLFFFPLLVLCVDFCCFNFQLLLILIILSLLYLTASEIEEASLYGMQG